MKFRICTRDFGYSVCNGGMERILNRNLILTYKVVTVPAEFLAIHAPNSPKT